MVIVEFKNGKTRSFANETEARIYEKRSKQKISKIANDNISNNRNLDIFTRQDSNFIQEVFDFLNNKEPQKKKKLKSEFKIERVKL